MRMGKYGEGSLLDCTLPDPAADALFAKPLRCLDLLALGAANDYCDWGVDARQEGYHASTIYLPGVAALARLALLRSRWQMVLGQQIAAVDDLLLALRTARMMIGRKPYFVDIIFSLGLEREAIGIAASQLAGYDSAARQHFVIGWGKLPVSTTIDVTSESHCVRGVLESILALTPAQRTSFLASQYGLTAQTEAKMDLSDEALRPLTDLCHAELTRWEKHMKRPAAELLPLPTPWSDNKNRLLAFILVERPLKSVVGSKMNQLRCQSMLLAGLARLADGEAGMAAHPDPLTGKPFQCEATSSGFSIIADTVEGYKPRNLVFSPVQSVGPDSSSSPF
jgi:hypothetical protein